MDWVGGPASTRGFRRRQADADFEGTCEDDIVREVIISGRQRVGHCRSRHLIERHFPRNNFWICASEIRSPKSTPASASNRSVRIGSPLRAEKLADQRDPGASGQQ